MRLVKSLHAAFRDVVGGGVGGVVAAVLLADLSWVVVARYGIPGVMVLAIIYWVLVRLVAFAEGDVAEDAAENEQERPRWPPHRAPWIDG